MWDTKDTRGPQRRLKRGTATGDIKKNCFPQIGLDAWNGLEEG